MVKPGFPGRPLLQPGWWLCAPPPGQRATLPTLASAAPLQLCFVPLSERLPSQRFSGQGIAVHALPGLLALEPKAASLAPRHCSRQHPQGGGPRFMDLRARGFSPACPLSKRRKGAPSTVISSFASVKLDHEVLHRFSLPLSVKAASGAGGCCFPTARAREGRKGRAESPCAPRAMRVGLQEPWLRTAPPVRPGGRSGLKPQTAASSAGSAWP